MAFFDKYPYTDFHEMNLDWLLNKMRELEIEFDEFKVVNNITFSGQWDITKQYPAWTIVSDNNIGYVSIQPVPVGVPLTNGSYWVEVIDYTAQIAGLESRVIAIEDDIRDNIKPDIQTLDDELSELSEFVHHFNIICISDSYGLGTDGDGLHWDERVKQALNISNANFHRSAINGSGFTPHSGQPTFLDQLTTISASITNKDEITDIIVLGGCNDRDASRSDILSYMNSFCTYAKANYINAKIHIAHAGRIWKESELPKFSGLTIPLYSRCGIYGANYIKGSENIMHQYSLFNADLIHPNADGVLEIGIAMVEGLLSDTCEVARTIIPTFNSYTAGIASATFDSPLRMTQQNNVIQALFQGLGSITVNFSAESSQSGNQDIGTLSDTLMFGGQYAPYGFTEATGLSAQPANSRRLNDEQRH